MTDRPPDDWLTDRDKGEGDNSPEEWTPPRRHPPAGTIIQPSRGARMRAVLLGVAMVVPMMALLPALNRYSYLGLAVVVQPELITDFESARSYLLLIFSGVILVIWFLSFALARLARNITEYRCYPPPGSHVLFPTELIVGERVDAIRRFCNMAAVALLVLAVVFFVALTQLYTESAGLLGGLQMLVGLYDKL